MPGQRPAGEPSPPGEAPPAGQAPPAGGAALASQPQLPDQPRLPDQPVAAPPPPPVPAAPPKKRRVGLIVTLTVVAAVAVMAVGGFLLVGSLREDPPQVGDCLTDEPLADDMEVVACDAAAAAWSVIGSDGIWTRGDFDTAEQGEVCQGFPATQQALWVTSAASVEATTEGEVICLAPIGGGG